MKKTLCLTAILIIIFSFAGCLKEKAVTSSDGEQIVYTEKGEGKTSYYLDIISEAGEKHYKINTDEETVGASLEKLGIIKGEQGDYGLFIHSVEGEEHLYEKDGRYWAFYVNGEYASASVDLTDITENTVYALKVN